MRSSKADVMMDVTLPKKDLVRALARTVGVATAKSTMPLLACVLLIASEGTLRAAATDLFVSVETGVSCDVAKAGTVAAPAKDLLDRIKAMPEGAIRISVTEGSTIVVRAVGAKREFRLRAMPGEDFPALPKPTNGRRIELPGATLAGALAHGAYAVSGDETRPHLNSALLEWTDEVLRVVSTDGHRLVVHETSGQGAARMLISLRGLGELRRLCDEAGPVRVVVEQAIAFFGTEDVTLGIKLVDAEFPPWEQVIPAARPWLVRTSRKTLIDAIRAVSIAASASTGAVVLKVAAGTIRLATEDPDGGDAVDEVPAEHGEGERSVKVAARYLLDALSGVEGDDVRIALDGELDAVVVEPIDGKGHTAVVMPMR